MSSRATGATERSGTRCIARGNNLAVNAFFRRVPNVHALPRYERAIAAVADLLTRQRIESVFLGNVACSAWLGRKVERGSLDVLALMTPQQKNPVTMMASHRGFRIDREEVEQSEELDLVPLHLDDEEGSIAVHVLVASNALYGRMVAAGIPVSMSELSLRVPPPEDLALLLSMAEDDQSQRDREMLTRLPEFDRRGFNERLVSIGLPQLVIAE